MAGRSEPTTSEEIAICLQANPVVVRRTMAGLREAGLVASERGHGGGWMLARDLSKISLRDVYAALGEPMLFKLGHETQNPNCILEQAVNVAVDDALHEAQTILVDRFSSIVLADLEKDFRRRIAAHNAPQERLRHAV